MAAPRRKAGSDPYRHSKLAVGYARYSDDKQGSIPEQEAINRELAQEHGLTIQRSFSDAATSRSLSRRSGLDDAYAYVEAHREIRFIVVNELERITAGLHQRAELDRFCQQFGVSLVTEENGVIGPHDEQQTSLADQRALAAKAEVAKVRRRTRRNLRQKVLAGTVAMRPAYGTRMRPLIGPDGQEVPKGMVLLDPQGRRVRSGVLEVAPDELPWLKRIFLWASEGMAYDKIARELTSAGVPTKTGGTRWAASSVTGILQNPLYKGEMTWGRQETLRDVDGKTFLRLREAGDEGMVTRESPLGALIDPELWAMANSRREAGIVRAGNRRKFASRLFDGLVFCALCGHKMYGRPDDRPTDGSEPLRWRYYCNGDRPGKKLPREGFGAPCLKAHSVSESQLLDFLGGVGQPNLEAQTAEGVRRPVASEAASKSLNDKLRTLRDQHARGLDLVIRGVIQEQEFVSQRGQLEADIAATLAQLENLNDESTTAQVVPLSAEQTAILSDLVPTLRHPLLPLTDKLAVLHSARISRFYCDGSGSTTPRGRRVRGDEPPVVQIQFLD